MSLCDRVDPADRGGKKLETLRLYPPVISVPKWTASSTQSITHEGTTYTILPGTTVNLSVLGMHYNARYWGPDYAVFSPIRWDSRNADSFLAQNVGEAGLSRPRV